MNQRIGRRIMPCVLLAATDERHKQQYDEEENMRNQHAIAICAAVLLLAGGAAVAQDVLPFPEPPMGGKVGPTMQESVHKWREAPRHLPADAPNILIVMLDDAGFGQPSAFGGEIQTWLEAREYEAPDSNRSEQ